MHSQIHFYAVPHIRLKLVLLCAAFAAVSYPHPAVAKLGEDMPALIKRFGANYQPIKPGRWSDAAYKFESKNCQVEVALKAGRSVSEYYYCFQPLVDGKPPEAIWRGIRVKNAPGAKWKSDEHGGLVSDDGHLIMWFSTENLPEQSTCGIGISDYYTLKEGQSATVPGKGANQVAAVQPAGKPALPSVGGVVFDTSKHLYPYTYFQIAESEGKQVYAAKTISALDCKVYDYPGHFVGLQEGEPLRVISVDPEFYVLLVSRLRFNTLAHVEQGLVTIR